MFFYSYVLTAVLIPLPDTSRAAGNFQTQQPNKTAPLSREQWPQVRRRCTVIATLFLASRNLSTFVKMTDYKLERSSLRALCVPKYGLCRERFSCAEQPRELADGCGRPPRPPPRTYRRIFSRSSAQIRRLSAGSDSS